MHFDDDIPQTLNTESRKQTRNYHSTFFSVVVNNNNKKIIPFNDDMIICLFSKQSLVMQDIT